MVCYRLDDKSSGFSELRKKDRRDGQDVARQMANRFWQGILVLAALVVSMPAAAQMMQRDGFQFLQAVRDRDGDTVTSLLNEPGSTLINTRDYATGENALHIVVQRRDTMWVQFLLQRGANPNQKDAKGVTPLQGAAQLGFIEGVAALLEGGARVDPTDGAGETPLISAVHRRDIALVELLVSKGANPDKADVSGRSARDYAALLATPQVLEAIEKYEAGGAQGDQSYGPN